MCPTFKVPSRLKLPYYAGLLLCHSAQILYIMLLIETIAQTNGLDTNIGINFTAVPESRVAPPGDRVFFNCKTNIGKGQQIRWLHNGVLLDPGTRSDVKITHDGQLSIKVRTSKRNRERQTGRYQCVAGMDGMFLMSHPAELSVAHLDRFPDPDSPDDVEANVGNTVLLGCKPPDSDPPAIIQWYKDGSLLNLTQDSDQSLINLKHLLLRNILTNTSGSFTCQASNHLTRDSVISENPVNLTVLPEEEPHKPRLLFAPEPEYHPVAGDSLTIPCSASGSPKPTIVWEHEAFNQQPVLIMQEGPRELLRLDYVTSNSSGEYTCKIFNYRGRKILRKTLVYVAERPRTEISSFRSRAPHREGDSLELHCAAEGFPLPEVYWVFNGKRWYRGSFNTRRDDHHQNDERKLHIEELQLSDAGIYQCFAENKAGTSSSAVLVRVVPTMTTMTTTTSSRTRQDKNSRRRSGHRKVDLVPPSAPNITQLSEDSVVLTWSVSNTTQKVQFFKVQYRDLGKRGDNHKSDWHTVDGEIGPSIRSFEIPGLLDHHGYRFRIGAVVDNDNVIGKVSRRFRMEAALQKAPTAIPHVKNILPLSQTSLSVQWILAQNATVTDEIEGYFINFRESSSAGPYNSLTIFGDTTHSHVLDNLSQGETYDIKVRAFNLNGAGPFSKVQYGRTLPSERKRRKKKKKLELKDAERKSLEAKEKKVQDEDVTLYLIIGVSLSVFCVLLITVCSVVTFLKRRRSGKQFSATNAAIHCKYQDTSLQITQHNSGMEEGNNESVEQETSFVHPPDFKGMLETSFSGTDHSLDNGGMDNSSQGSTALAQDSSRNLNFTSTSPLHTMDSFQSLAEEYTDEPSRVSWKRRRKSEEIL